MDIVYLHDPDDHAEQAFHEGYPALERLRSEGVVGAIGAAGMNQAEMLTRFVRDTDVDVVLCAGRYTLLDHAALTELLPGRPGARYLGGHRRRLQLGPAGRPEARSDLQLHRPHRRSCWTVPCD